MGLGMEGVAHMTLGGPVDRSLRATIGMGVQTLLYSSSAQYRLGDRDPWVVPCSILASTEL